MKQQTEYEKFDKTLRALLSVPRAELQKKLAEDKKRKASKKVAKAPKPRQAAD